MKRLLIGLGLVILVIGGIGAVYGQQIGLLATILTAHKPGPFDQTKAPPVPDYGQKSSWAADGGGDSNMWGPLDQKLEYPESRTVDVFFIHPTTYFSNDRWNQDVADADTNKRTDDGPIKNQASAFNACCRLYAPRYRQMTFSGFVKYDADSQAAMDLAYSDVKRAFEYYLAHYNHGRPFIIAGHSQGARHARTLLADMIDGTKLQKQLVAAYVVGNWIDEDWFAARKTIEPCERADDTGCVLTWSSILEGEDGQKARADFGVRSGLLPDAASHKYVCTNPLLWTTGSERAPATMDIGGWVYGRDDKPLPPVPNLISARCDDGALFISKPSGISFNILEMPGGNYHNYDYQLAYMNIRENARDRARAFLSQAH